jgi:xanthine/uracil permease
MASYLKAMPTLSRFWRQDQTWHARLQAIAIVIVIGIVVALIHERNKLSNIINAKWFSFGEN